MMGAKDFLLVGGGVASARCAAMLRKQGADGRITIVGAEAEPPYNRPPLSKGVLLGREDPARIYPYPQDYYERHSIDLVLGATIAGVDAAAKTAKAADGREFAYEKLLAATGASPRRLNIPGSDLNNIFYLRTLPESLAIKGMFKPGRRAVIVGAGFIGMELASAFVQNGLETTMLVRESGLFTRLGSARLSKFFEDYYLSQGVKIVYNDSAVRFEGGAQVERVVTVQGLSLDCDLTAVGIGVAPEVGWLQGSGVELSNGVVVDEYLQSGNPDIYAAGDIANFYDPIFKKRRRIEHWDNAIKQGELAALNMLGQNVAYDTVAYFFSDIFDLSWEWLGDNSDIDATVTRGSLADRSAIIFYLKENRLKAAFLLMQSPKERLWVERAIVEGLEFGPERQAKLADASYPLDAVISAQSS
ncbi:MAG: FAD-dependent oxidoreductase [Actinomycetota bacterium]|nr:FAD-dependent oxidoreductase [Actinomycetota bacterium]